jgi:IS5 family transposase
MQSMRAFCGLELGRDAIPDETTILNFRHLLERHELTKAIFEGVAEHLAAKGELLRGGTIVDATLIAASPSTKNREQKRDPEMTQSKKANQWYFGMKAHIGVDAKSGLVHTAGVTTGKVHDAKVMANLVREDDTAVYGYKGYASDAKKRAAEAAVPGTLTLRESAARLRPLFHAPQHAGADLARLIWINGERLHPAFRVRVSILQWMIDNAFCMFLHRYAQLARSARRRCPPSWPTTLRSHK